MFMLRVTSQSWLIPGKFDGWLVKFIVVFAHDHAIDAVAIIYIHAFSSLVPIAVTIAATECGSNLGPATYSTLDTIVWYLCASDYWVHASILLITAKEGECMRAHHWRSYRFGINEFINDSIIVDLPPKKH